MEPGGYQTKINEPAAMEGQLRQRWEMLSDEMKKEYGEEFLDKSTWSILQTNYRYTKKYLKIKGCAIKI